MASERSRKKSGVGTGSGPIRPANLATLAHAEINRRIMTGELREGEKIVIADMADDLGTSMIPVREALSRLSADRLVIYEPNKGFRVAPAPDSEEIANLFEARLVIELGALDLGIAHVTPEIIRTLSEINDRIRSDSYEADFEGFEGFIVENARFHEILVGLAGNPFLVDAYRRLSYHERIPQILTGRGVRDIVRIVEEHDQIIAALGKGSISETHSALSAHIRDAYERLPPPQGHSLRSLNVSIPAR